MAATSNLQPFLFHLRVLVEEEGQVDNPAKENYIQEEHTERGRAEPEVDAASGEKDCPVLEQDAPQVLLHLLHGVTEPFALNHREEDDDDDGKDGRLDELIDADLVEERIG